MARFRPQALIRLVIGRTRLHCFGRSSADRCQKLNTYSERLARRIYDGWNAQKEEVPVQRYGDMHVTHLGPKMRILDSDLIDDVDAEVRAWSAVSARRAIKSKSPARGRALQAAS
jgi:hypothetical protein